MKNYSWSFKTENRCRSGGADGWAKRVLFFSGLLLMGLMLWGCTDPPEPQTSAPADQIGAVDAYVFEPDPQDYLTAPYPVPLSPQMSSQEALTALGTHLSQSYFIRDSGRGTASIRFEVLDVHHLPAPHRTYRLAVINMIDPGQEALQGFFQGSAGGQTTFYMLAATFLQPHLGV